MKSICAPQRILEKRKFSKSGKNGRRWFEISSSHRLHQFGKFLALKVKRFIWKQFPRWIKISYIYHVTIRNERNKKKKTSARKKIVQFCKILWSVVTLPFIRRLVCSFVRVFVRTFVRPLSTCIVGQNRTTQRTTPLTPQERILPH